MALIPPSVRAIAGNTGWLMADRLTRMLIGVTVGAWIARHLGPESFGALAYVLAFLAFFQVATSLGLDLVLARELARSPQQAHQLLGTSLRLRLSAGLLGWIVACASMTLARPGDLQALTLTALAAASLLLQPADLVDLWFQSRTESRRAVVPRISSFLLVSAIRVALIVQDAPLWAFAAAYVVDAALAAAFLALSYRRLPTAMPWQWHMGTARRLLTNAWPMLLSGMSIIAYMRIDQIMIRGLSGDRELGLYSAILPFSQAWHFIPATICASATPFLVRMLSEQPAQFKRRVCNLFSLLAWASLAICLAVALGSGALVGVLLGEQYVSAADVLAVHVFTNIPVFLGVAQVAYLTIVGRTNIVMLQTLAGLGASIALNLVLIPRYGALGAAISSVIAYTVSAIAANALLAPDLFKMQLLSLVHGNAKAT